MTVREDIKLRLFECGLWPEETEIVVRRVSEQDACKDVKWGNEAHCYPPQLLATLWSIAKETAVKYIDECKPAHFARAVLIGGLK